MKEKLPERVNINKLLVHRDTTLGSRLWHQGGYYVVVGSEGVGIREHWVCGLDTDQGHRFERTPEVA